MSTFDQVAGGRPGWPGGNNDYLTPGPHNLPGQSRLLTTITGRGSAQSTTPVREVNRYPNLIVVGFTVGSADVLAVTIPDTPRIFLAFRALGTNTGSVYVAFGRLASISSATFELTAGVQMLLDTTIPQDDVHIAGSAANQSVVISYGNSSL